MKFKQAIIPEQKLTKYLLVFRQKDDKSKFLQKAGYNIDNWQQLESDLRTQILRENAIWVEETSYGNKYKIDGTLRGINGIELEVRTIWIVETNNDQARFVTLVPRG